MPGDRPPAGALVVAHPDLAVGGAQIEPDRVIGVGAEGLALDREPALLGRETAVLPLPRTAAVTGAIDGRPPGRFACINQLPMIVPRVMPIGLPRNSPKMIPCETGCPSVATSPPPTAAPALASANTGITP